MSNVEVKVIFKEDNDLIRILRGIIEKEDKDFIFLRRRDGMHRIGKAYIVKIEEGSKA